MTLREYIDCLEEIVKEHGDDIPVKSQTLTHTWDIDLPIVKEHDAGRFKYLLINP